MPKKRKFSHKSENNNLLYLLIVVVLLASFFLVGKSINKPLTCPAATTNQSANQTSDIRKLIAFVDDAAVLIASEGEKAYPQFRVPNSRWWQGNDYIFVYDMNGKTLVLPPTQNIEGANRWSIKDTNGVYYVREMIKQLSSNASGWISYVYPKPGETNPSLKLSYFKKVGFGGKTVLVGSGIYIK